MTRLGGVRKALVFGVIVAIFMAACSDSGDGGAIDSLTAGTQDQESTQPNERDNPLGDPGRITYAERRELLEAIGVKYPAVVVPDTPLDEFGMWGGILMQTGWQEDSDREPIALWNLLNYSLSVESTIYEKSYAEAGNAADLATACAENSHVQGDLAAAEGDVAVDRATACGAWMAFFAGTDAGMSDVDLQRAMWRAHTVSLVNKLREERDVLDRPTSPTPEEFNFWSSWLEVVFILDVIVFPTGGETTVPVAQTIMPPCAPLGTEGCEITPADLGQSFSFVSALAGRPGSVARIFDRYELLVSNPAAIIPTTLADPALAGAVVELLKTAGVDASAFASPLCQLPVPVGDC